MNVNLPHTVTDTDSGERLLSDLRQAVKAEIAATKSRAAVFRAEVWSGKLHTESERNHIYTFLLDTVVPLADDMPGELHVGGRCIPAGLLPWRGCASQCCWQPLPPGSSSVPRWWRCRG